MDTPFASALDTENTMPPPAGLIYNHIIQYYAVAGPDYETWSPSFNMHFGYCRKLSDIFSLEKMLVNMNDKVLEQLRINPAEPSAIIDLGCGMATVARHAAKKYPLANITAVTIVDYQVEKADHLNKEQGFENRIKLCKENFESLPMPAASFTHAYAIESACHACSKDKETFIAEMARILKDGGRFCIADGFLKTNSKKPRHFSWLYKKISDYWAVPGFACIHDFENRLKEYGLHHIQVKEISYRIAPSVAWVPLICLKFFVKELWRNRSLKMKKERWNNVYAPLLGMLMGLYRKHFGYYIVCGNK